MICVSLSVIICAANDALAFSQQVGVVEISGHRPAATPLASARGIIRLPHCTGGGLPKAYRRSWRGGMWPALWQRRCGAYGKTAARADSAARRMVLFSRRCASLGTRNCSGPLPTLDNLYGPPLGESPIGAW